MQVAVTITKFLNVKPAAQKRISKCQANGLCLACEKPLGEGKSCRHCHESCYRVIKRAIAAGLTTDAEEVANGYMAERRPGGRPPSHPVSKRLMS